MKIVYADRVKENTTTTGTGTYTLGGAATGFTTFLLGVTDTYQTCYCCEDGTNWEVGYGTYASAGNTLTRDLILASSNAGAAVSWAAGTKTIYTTHSGKGISPIAYAQAGLTATTTPQATGTDAFAMGSGALASAAWAIAMGLNTQSTGSSGVAIGTTATSTGGVAIGSNSISAAGGVAIGPSAAITGSGSGVSIQGSGGGNVVSGGTAANVGGTTNTASGTSAATVGGSNNTASKSFSSARGYYGLTRFYTCEVLGGGDSSAASVGGAQAERVLQFKTTTDATTTNLGLGGLNSGTGNGYLALPANSAATVIVHVIGRETATGDCASFRLEGCLQSNGSGVPALIGTVPTAVSLGYSTNASTWTAVLGVDAATKLCLLVQVTGQAAKTIKWVARIEFVEVGV